MGNDVVVAHVWKEIKKVNPFRDDREGEESRISGSATSNAPKATSILSDAKTINKYGSANELSNR